jgi:hypothetical protein
MRRSLPWVLALAAFGCSSNAGEPPPKRSPQTAKRTRPVDTSAPMGLAKPDLTRVQLDLTLVRAAIKKHMQLEGGIPPSIEVLEVKLRYPADLRYDPKTGVVRSRTYPYL